MLYLSIEKLGHSYGVRELFHHVDLEVRRGDRIGFVGRNGEGKSTLIRLLAGLEEPESGQVRTFCRMAYVPQAVEAAPGQLVQEWLAAQGVTVQASVLQELGLRATALGLPLASLSGGEQTKVALAAAMSGDPELLLLDEPTNHLDVEALRKLEAWFKRKGLTLVVISHDRRFLDEVTNTTWAIDRGQVTTYPGNYSAYANWVAQEQARVAHEYETYLKEKDRLEEAVRQKQLWAQKGEKGRIPTDTFARIKKGADWASAARMAVAAKAIEKRLDRLQPEEKPEHRLEAKLSFLDFQLSARPVLIQGTGVTFGYADRPLLQATDFQVGRGDRIALVGPNGAGKTTLLQLLTGALTPQAGTIRVTPTATLGYFDQVFASLPLEKTLLDDLLGLPDIDATTARVFLGSFQFRRDDAFKKLGMLSYGERVRYVFVKLILSRPNTLLLDEPSNHLDIATREELESSLADYPGAMLCASHDRYFLERLTNKVWELRDGRLTVHPYGYREYLERQNQPAPSKKARRQHVQNELLVLETRIAWLSGELHAVTEASQKAELEREFLQASRTARELRQQLNS